MQRILDVFFGGDRIIKSLHSAIQRLNSYREWQLDRIAQHEKELQALNDKRDIAAAEAVKANDLANNLSKLMEFPNV